MQTNYKKCANKLKKHANKKRGLEKRPCKSAWYHGLWTSWPWKEAMQKCMISHGWCMTVIGQLLLTAYKKSFSAVNLLSFIMFWTCTSMNVIVILYIQHLICFFMKNKSKSLRWKNVSEQRSVMRILRIIIYVN